MSLHHQPEGDPSNDSQHGLPESLPPWVANLTELVQTRITLMRLESREVVAGGILRIILIAAAAVFALVAWVLLIAAIVGVVQAYLSFGWYWTCLILAGLHGIALVVMLRRVRAPGPAPFPHTRSEFQKDQAWLQHLQQPKSKR